MRSVGFGRRPSAILTEPLVGELRKLRAAVVGTIVIIFFISLPLLGAEMRFKTMKLPPNAHVRIEGSTARIEVEK